MLIIYKATLDTPFIAQRDNVAPDTPSIFLSSLSPSNPTPKICLVKAG